MCSDLLALRHSLGDHLDVVCSSLDHLDDGDLGEDVGLLGGVAEVTDSQHSVVLVKRVEFAEVEAEQSGEVGGPGGELQAPLRAGVAEYQGLKAVSGTGETAGASRIGGLGHQIAARGLNQRLSKYLPCGGIEELADSWRE